MAQKAPHRFQLTVVNSSNIGFIDSFYWVVPSGVSISKFNEGDRHQVWSLLAARQLKFGRGGILVKDIASEKFSAKT